jgi:tRNA threonylcarbamoyladenosine biosynthesis protein TsaB
MQLSIEAASDDPGLALSRDGDVLLSKTWHTQQNHSKELLPNIERLLQEARTDKHALTAVFVDIGPGGYAALRVGVSTAKALAHALGVPIVGAGRLELDARLVAHDAGDRRIVAVHRAGRGDIAWAAYRRDSARDWLEEAAPQLGKPDELRSAINAGDILTGDIDDELARTINEAGASIATPNAHRVTALAAVGHERVAAGRVDDPTALVPLYLRAPAIGPQKQG